MLIKCPECSHDVSDMADSCPHCGYPIMRLYNEEVDRLMSKIKKTEFVVPEPRMRVCIRCGKEWAVAPGGKYPTKPQCNCKFLGKAYPSVEVDNPADRTDIGALLYVQIYCLDPRNIGDEDAIENTDRQYNLFRDKMRVETENQEVLHLENWEIKPDPPEEVKKIWDEEEAEEEKAKESYTPPPVPRRSSIVDNRPKCPICGSYALSKITFFDKTMMGVFGGVYAVGDMSKTWRCNRCKSKF